ncbi:MAG: acyl carrier protein [Acidobacteriaceae bacterium]|nr:acyl carrier protein [Acidobacteriaceae bacterium]
MDETYERLVRCFERIFPDLDPNAIPGANTKNTAAWDSIAQVTLVSLIGEEFGIDIDFEEFEEATSFDAVLQVVRARVANARA